MKVRDLPPRADDDGLLIRAAVDGGRISVCAPAAAANVVVRPRREATGPDVRKLSPQAVKVARARQSAGYAAQETKYFQRRDRRALARAKHT